MSETTETKTELTPEQELKAQAEFQAFAKNRLNRYAALIKKYQFFFEELDMAKRLFDAIKAIAMKQPLILPAGVELSEHEKNKYLRDTLGWGHYRINSMTFDLDNRTLAQEVCGIFASYCNGLQAKIEEVEPPVKTEESTTPKGPYIIDAGTPNLEAVQ